MESANDMKAAKRTYEGFVGLIKWSVPVIAIMTFVVVLAIAE